MTAGAGDLGFSFRATKTGDVAIRRGSAVVTILRGGAARKFLSAVAPLPAAGQQQVMARATGNYQRGNERLAKRHPRRGTPGE
jgi:hypothetical protein